MSFYVPPAALDKHRKAFVGVDLGKSCMRFTRLEQVDRNTLRRLIADVYRLRRKG